MKKLLLLSLLLLNAACNTYSKWKEDAEANGHLIGSSTIYEKPKKLKFSFSNNDSDVLLRIEMHKQKMIARFYKNEYALIHYQGGSYLHCTPVLPIYGAYGNVVNSGQENCTTINIPPFTKRIALSDYRAFYKKYAEEIGADEVIAYGATRSCAKEEKTENSVTCLEYNNDTNEYAAFFFKDEKQVKKEMLKEENN